MTIYLENELRGETTKLTTIVRGRKIEKEPPLTLFGKVNSFMSLCTSWLRQNGSRKEHVPVESGADEDHAGNVNVVCKV